MAAVVFFVSRLLVLKLNDSHSPPLPSLLSLLSLLLRGCSALKLLLELLFLLFIVILSAVVEVSLLLFFLDRFLLWSEKNMSSPLLSSSTITSLSTSIFDIL